MDNIKKVKRQPTEWKKIFANHNSDKGLTFRKHKELQLNNKKTIQLKMVPGLGKSPGKGNGHPLQHSCLENQSPGQRSLAGYSPQGCKESDMMEQLNTAQHI